LKARLNRTKMLDQRITKNPLQQRRLYKYTKPIVELPELLRQAGYVEEAKRLEREFTMRKIIRLVAEMKEANHEHV